MADNKPKEAYQHEIIREGEDTILKIYCDQDLNVPSVEDNPVCMAKTVEKLMANKGITKIVFNQKQDFEYEYDQVKLLNEVAALINKLMREKDHYTVEALTFNSTVSRHVNTWYNLLKKIIFSDIKSDPIGCYVQLRRHRRAEQIKMQRSLEPKEVAGISKYLELINYLIGCLEHTNLITVSQPYLAGFVIGKREVYRRIFNPSIKPDFMYTKLMSQYPKGGEELTNYSVGNTEVVVFELPSSTKYLYHIMPPEFKLNEEQYEVLDAARQILSEHKPEKEDFVDPARMREVFYNVGHDLLQELTEHKGMKLKMEELEELTEILIRYTVGFGLLEVLLADDKMQDVNINSPMGKIPAFIVHQDYDDCMTNVIPTVQEAESWATKLRLISGRPLDEANPILDTELELPGASVRVSAITRPLDPSGLGFSYRKHRDKPWTFPLFIKFKMMTPLAAGLLSFLVDGTRTFLICGTRGSGKSSVLTSLIVEIMRRRRVITIEDTLELPHKALRDLGFNIQPLKVASALSRSSSEMSAEDGIRSTLRLGDSALIVGEVRSGEAKALYEAMRVGAAANVVAGTIHGDSPYGIYDRLVNDIGVPKTSFKATDICVIANPIKSADGLHKYKRITQITEVRKDWDEDPSSEGAFVDLLKYSAKTDQLELSDELGNGESDIIKQIAGGVREWAGNWDAVWENIELRAKVKELQVEIAKKEKNDDLLEAEFTILCNDMFHNITEKVHKRYGKLDANRILFEWKEWLQREVRRRKHKNGGAE